MTLNGELREEFIDPLVIQAEQSVLGAVFLESSVLDDISFLEDRDFIVPKHQQIYKVMKWLDKRNEPVDVVTVAEMYLKHNKIGEVNMTYLAELANSCPTAANAVHYAKIVRSSALERRVRNTGHILTGMNREDYESDEEFFSRVEELVAEIRPVDNSKMLAVEQTRENYFEYLKKKAEFIPTGFKKFDDWAHGVWRGWLFVSAGRPSVGKTAMLLQRVLGVALQKQGLVMIYSQEMDRNQLYDRMMANLTGIPYPRIKHKKLTKDDMDLIEYNWEMLESLPIYIDDRSNVSIDEIRADARRMKRKHGKIAMIAVDYLQIMNIPQKKSETRSQAIGNVTKAAKDIARQMNCCFMMLSQMTRDSETYKKPMLSHLKESGAIEQDADVVEFLWHDPNDTHPQGKVIQQFIAKGRDTGINEFRLLFKGWKQKFEEL